MGSDAPGDGDIGDAPNVSRKPNGGTVLSIWQRDKGRCWICAHGVRQDEASRDHVKPRGLGGYDKAKNYRLAHMRCNTARHRTPEHVVVKIRESLPVGASSEAVRGALAAYHSEQDRAGRETSGRYRKRGQEQSRGIRCR